MNRYAVRARRSAQLGQPENFGLLPLEGVVSSRVRSALERISCHVSSTQQTRKSRQTVGMFDLFVVHSGRQTFAWVEVKTAEGRLSRCQEAWAIRVEAAGVPCLVVTSPEDAVRQFAALPRRTAL